ncbi:MAG: hypothetical protein R2788_09400 [Saprospiraceae bacterium]
MIAENTVGFFKQAVRTITFLFLFLFQLRYSFNNDLLNVSVNTDDGVLFNANEGFIHYSTELEDRLFDEKPLLVKRL